jgi:hypothetical protein
MSSVHRWRPAFQADFAARLDWCVRPLAAANHPPVVRIAGDPEREAATGEVVTLDATGSTDPDGDALDFAWSIYPASPELLRAARIEGQTTAVARLTFAPGLAGQTIPALLAVTDRGRPGLTRYGRVFIRVGATP